MDRGLLNDATSSDDSPTPGYMLSEIARSTLANYTACLQLEEYLCSKLAKGNHNSKYKCLLLIKHVCRTGRVDFKKDMCKHVAVVKECLQFKGPPDPLRGDEIYRRVREAAKEVLDVLFDSTMPVTTSSVAASNRIQGFGSNYTPEEDPNTTTAGSGGTGKSYFKSVTSAISNAMSSGVGADGTSTKYTNYNPEATASNPNPTNAAASPSMHSSTYNGAASANNRYGGGAPSGSQASPTVHTSASGMSGIGNPNFRDPRDEAAQSSVSSYINKASAYLSGGGGGGAPAGGRGPTLGEISYNNTGASGSTDYNFASNRGVYTPSSSGGGGGGGGAWQNGQGSAPAPASAPAAAGVVPEFAAPSVPGQGKAGTAAADGSYESNLVAALVQPSGMKVAVPVDSAPVQNFLRCAVTLNAEVIGSCLSGYLSLEEGNTTPWQSRVKTLMLLGHLVGAAGCEHHREWWVGGNAHQLVSSLCTAADGASVKPLVRSTAVKTLDLMGFDVSMYSSVAAPAPAKRGSVRVASVSPKPPGAGAAPANAGRKESIDLLGDMCDSPAAPATVPAAAPTAFTASPPMASAAVPAPAPLAAPAPQQAQAQVVDLFADMGISGASTSASVPVSAVEHAPPAPPAPTGNKFDVFDLLDDAPAPIQQAQAQVPQEEASVFSFLGGGGGGAQAGGSPNMSAAQPNYGNSMQQQQSYGTSMQQPNYGNNQGMGYGMSNQGMGVGGMGMPSNSMTSITAQRKEIPTEAALHSTVFGGTNNQPRYGMQQQQQAQQQYRGNAAPQADSFSFVQDAMKGKGKK